MATPPRASRPISGRPGDPRVGIAGQSYGGGISLLAAAYDKRIDAIAPQITWYDLADSLFPDATGKGAANGPNLTGPTFLHVDGSFDSFVHLITTGVPADQIKDPAHKIPMGARGGRGGPLSDDQIKAVAAYVFTLSHH